MEQIYQMILIAALGFILTIIITPLIGRYMRSIGKIGRDVHKIDRPEVPESGGIGFMLVYLILLVIGIVIAPTEVSRYRLIIMVGILTMVTLLGLYDDFKQLSAIMKPGILVILALPVFFFRQINGNALATPTPMLPFIGETSLTIAYWVLAIFVVAIPSNASNMLDVMNGSMSGSSIIIAFTALLSTFLIPLDENALFIGRFASLTLMAVLLGFWWYNRYPAKIFAGDTGSLGAGAAIGLIAVYARLEFVLVVALLVHIMNSFSIISSIGGLRERHDIRERPVKVIDGIIHASRNKNAPITMVRLLVARRALGEKEIVNRILLLVIFVNILAIITAFIIGRSL
ncbi:MAG: hypothetical protein INQ03_07555 [Candidatus Heimdallarchaeota archaeon]|nr:hypothetical protein [Candidatus Heimdallarchaeota archaeon]